MKLRPYHNPQQVDESRVPDGWRFLYEDEPRPICPRPCRLWQCGRLTQSDSFGGWFTQSDSFGGWNPRQTYITRV